MVTFSFQLPSQSMQKFFVDFFVKFFEDFSLFPVPFLSIFSTILMCSF